MVPKGKWSHNSHVMKANIAILKNNLSKYVRTVREGGEVIVLDRDQPVARLVPYREVLAQPGGSDASGDDDARLAGLLTRGAISHRGTADGPMSSAPARPPQLPPDAPSLSALFQRMRDEERW